jgi:hypothetical protein
VFAAFERSIALDPGFAPAYIHAIEYAFQLRGRGVGRRYTAAYLALGPTDEAADEVRLIDRVTDPARAAGPATLRAIDSLPSSVVRGAMYSLRRWPDSAQTAVALVRAVARRPTDTPMHATDSAFVQSYLPLTLAYRGRLRESYEALGNRRSRLFAELVLLAASNATRPMRLRALARRWVAARAIRAPVLGRPGEPRRDPPLPRARRFGDRGNARRGGAQRSAARPRAADAYLALAGRDTAAAIRAFAALSDTLCLGCYLDRLTEARLLAARGSWTRPTSCSGSGCTPSSPRPRSGSRRARTRGAAAERSHHGHPRVPDRRRRVGAGRSEVQPMVQEARRALRELGVAGGGEVVAAPHPAPTYARM